MAVVLPIKTPSNVTFTPPFGPFEGEKAYVDCRGEPNFKVEMLAESLTKLDTETHIYLCLGERKIEAKKPKRKIFHRNAMANDDMDLLLRSAHMNMMLMLGAPPPSSGVHEKASPSPNKEDLRSVLYKILDDHGLSDVECYTRSNLDRKLYAKIRKPKYTPKKVTLFAIVIGCRLTLEESKRLLEQGGYAFSPSIELDVFIRDRVIKQDYNSIHDVNMRLFERNLDCLGSDIR